MKTLILNGLFPKIYLYRRSIIVILICGLSTFGAVGWDWYDEYRKHRKIVDIMKAIDPCRLEIENRQNRWEHFAEDEQLQCAELFEHLPTSTPYTVDLWPSKITLIIHNYLTVGEEGKTHILFLPYSINAAGRADYIGVVHPWEGERTMRSKIHGWACINVYYAETDISPSLICLKIT